MAAHQAPPSLGFSRQEHWSGLPFPSPVHKCIYVCGCVCVCALSCLVVSYSFWSHGLSPPGSSIHRIFQTRILEEVTVSSSRRLSIPRDQTCVSCISRWFFTTVSPGKFIGMYTCQIHYLIPLTDQGTSNMIQLGQRRIQWTDMCRNSGILIYLLDTKLVIIHRAIIIYFHVTVCISINEYHLLYYQFSITFSVVVYHKMMKSGYNLKAD